MAEKLRPESHPAGTRIIREGEEGETLYLIGEGAVDVVLNEGAPAREQLATPKAGQFFGEVAIVEDRPCTATVVATEPVRLYALHKNDFREALAGSESMQKELLKLFSQRYRDGILGKLLKRQDR